MAAKRVRKNQLTPPKAIWDQMPEGAEVEAQAGGERIMLTPARISRADAVRDKLAALGITEQDVADAVAWARKAQ